MLTLNKYFDQKKDGVKTDKPPPPAKQQSLAKLLSTKPQLPKPQLAKPPLEKPPCSEAPIKPPPTKQRSVTKKPKENKPPVVKKPTCTQNKVEMESEAVSDSNMAKYDTVLSMGKALGVSAATTSELKALLDANSDVELALTSLLQKVFEDVKREAMSSTLQSPSDRQVSAKRPRLDTVESSTTIPTTDHEKPKIVACLEKVTLAGKGRVDIQFSSDLFFFEWRGKTSQIRFDSIEKIIQLPHPLTQKKQQTTIVVVFRENNEKEFSYFNVLLREDESVNVSSQDKSNKTITAKLQTGKPTIDWLGSLISEFSGVKLDSQPTATPIKCHKKAGEGFLYLFEGGILFLTKALWLPLNRVSRLEIGASSKYQFDLEVELEDEEGDVVGETPQQKKKRQKGLFTEFTIPRTDEQVVIKYIQSQSGEHHGRKNKVSASRGNNNSTNNNNNNNNNNNTTQEAGDIDSAVANYNSEDDDDFEMASAASGHEDSSGSDSEDLEYESNSDNETDSDDDEDNDDDVDDDNNTGVQDKDMDEEEDIGDDEDDDESDEEVEENDEDEEEAAEDDNGNGDR